MTEYLLPAAFGFGAGILSAWGIGGGTLLTVCMTLLIGIDHRQAQAVNLLFFLPTAALSLWFHRKNGLIDREAWIDSSIPGTVIALLASLAALSVDVSLLRKPFGIFLIANALLLFRGTRSEQKK